MEVVLSAIHQILIFRFDEIPFSRLAQRVHLGRLAALFEFGEMEVGQDASGAPVINGQMGVWRDETNDHTIRRLVVESRRVLLDLDGTSADADRAVDKLRKFLAELAGRPSEGFMQPVVRAEESEIVARMDFTADRLFPRPLWEFFMGEVVRLTSSGLARASVRPDQLKFEVNYQSSDQSLDDYRISLIRKELVLGPRQGYPLTEQVYYSKAPLGTEAHLQLLRELETTLASAQA